MTLWKPLEGRGRGKHLRRRFRMYQINRGRLMAAWDGFGIQDRDRVRQEDQRDCQGPHLRALSARLRSVGSVPKATGNQ